MASSSVHWRGEALAAGKQAGEAAAVEKVRAELEEYLKATLHRVSGEMADESFAEVISTDTETFLSAGSDSDHTIFHELGWHRTGANGKEIVFEGHPQLREALDAYGPKFAAAIAVGVRDGLARA